MKSVGIIYFSGTGNTELVTEFIAKSLRSKYDVDVFRIEDLLKKKAVFDSSKYEMIGFGHPVYGFGAPPIFERFVKTMKRVKGIKTFVYSTCAGPLYLNDIASYGFIDVLKERGFHVFYERQFYMPANIATRYNDNVSKQLCMAAQVKSRRMAMELFKGTRRLRRDKIGPMILQWLYKGEKYAWKWLPKDFIVQKSCSHCGRCVAQCPMDNIEEINGKITFGEDCIACYRCVYNCPEKAIQGDKFKVAIFKEGYNIRKIFENKLIPGNYVQRTTHNYYGIFRKYLFRDR